MIYLNSPENEEFVHAMVDSSLLSKDIQISTNYIFMNQDKYKFNSVEKEFNKEKYNKIIVDSIGLKNDISILLSIFKYKIIKIKKIINLKAIKINNEEKKRKDLKI